MRARGSRRPEDFPADHWNFLQSRGINPEGVQRAPGKTFRWSGEYMWDMNTRETRSVALNVFETFSPKLPDHFKSCDYVLLANIAPDLQLQVLDQMEKPKFVIADTMDLWINIAQPALLALLKRVDMIILNVSEARELTKETSLIKAGKKIQSLGPRIVAVKKGEHGCLLFGEDNDFFSCHIPNDRVQAQRLKTKLDGPALQPGGFQDVFDQVREAIRLLVDYHQEFLLGLLIPACVLPQKAGAVALDAPQWCPQLMGDGADEILLQLHLAFEIAQFQGCFPPEIALEQ